MWAIWFTYNIDQHCTLLHSTDAAGYRNKQQTNRYNNHEGGRREEVVVHENAEVVKNRRDCGADSHQQEGREL